MGKAIGLILFITSTALYFSSFTLPRNISFDNAKDPGTYALADRHQQDKAEINYREFCSGCHGEKMEAFTDRKWKHGNAKDSLFKAIKAGYPNEGMPGFDTTFTDNEITSLVNYIVTGIENVKRYEFQDQPARSNLFESSTQSVRLDTVVKGLKVPWGIAFLPNGEMLITERSGELFRLTKNKVLQKIEGVPEVLAEGQGGLLDIALHPDFKTNAVVYLSYSIPKTSEEGVLSTTAVSRAVLKGNTLLQQKKIFEALPYSKTRHHYGSRLQFDAQKNLYITVGDRGNHDENPQSLERYPGKVHRIKEDGSIPADNPFVNKTGAVPSIYSFGHRNIQGMVINPETGVLWSNEHGPRGGDEINIIKKGENYGWPVISYGLNYNGTVLTKNSSLEGMEQPLLYWLPSIGPSGMAFVTGERYKSWKGHLLVGSLRFKYLNLCKVEGDKISGQEILLKNVGRLRDVRMGPDGYIYVSVENPGAIFRLVPVKGDAAAAVTKDKKNSR